MIKTSGKKYQISIIIILASLESACLAPPKPDAILDKQHFQQTVTIDDQPSETVVTFSTLKGFQERYGIYQVVWNDNFLRGFIDKTTGQKTFQVYNVIYYAGSGTTDSTWKNFSQVDYQTPKGEINEIVKVIKKHEDCSSLPLYGQCLYSEHVTFEMSESLLRRLANAYTPLPQKYWQYILTAKSEANSEANHEDNFLLAELAGLLARMDKYKISTVFQPHTRETRKKPHENPKVQPESTIVPPPAKILLPILQKNKPQ